MDFTDLTERTDICMKADAWFIESQDKRAELILLAERGLSGDNMTASFGGNRDLLVKALANAMMQNPQIAHVAYDALEIYADHVKEQYAQYN